MKHGAINDLKGKMTDTDKEIYKIWYPAICTTASKEGIYPDWLIFSNFKNWAQEKGYKGKFFARNVILENNTDMHPDKCVFVSEKVMRFLTVKKIKESSLPTGVYKPKNTKNYVAACANPFTRVQENIGYFKTAEDAHKAWRAKKHEYAKVIAQTETDPVVIKALLTRYSD